MTRRERYALWRRYVAEMGGLSDADRARVAFVERGTLRGTAAAAVTATRTMRGAFYDAVVAAAR